MLDSGMEADQALGILGLKQAPHFLPTLKVTSLLPQAEPLC
jgi:hypothetical protein